MAEPSQSAAAGAGGAERRAAVRSLLPSLFINALCPFLAYRALESHYPATSVMPLLYATIFPVIGFASSLVRKRTLDGIAFLVMVGLGFHIIVTILSPTVETALVVRSLGGAIIGLAFIVSVLIGRPIVLIVVRQALASRNRERAAILDRIVANNGARAFSLVTVVWGAGLIAMSAIHVILAMVMPPADFLLAAPIVGVVTVLGLILWTGRFFAARRRRWLQGNRPFDRASESAR